MSSTAHRNEFAPPAQPGMLRAMGLAILAHLLLVAALTWGVNWKSKATQLTTAEAELWSSLPQQAAPRAVQPPPAPTPPEPKPVAKLSPAPAPPPEKLPQKAPDIVDKVDKPLKKKPVPPPEKPPEPEPPPKVKPKPTAPPPPTAAELKKAAQQRAAEEAKVQTKEAEAQREANLKRITGIAGASGGATATGNAAQSSGPSSGYSGRIKAKVRPNLVFTSTISGNPKVEIEVRLAPDGTILGRPRVVKSSGNPEWDDAVVRAFEKTETLPRDADGRVYSPMIVEWRVND